MRFSVAGLTRADAENIAGWRYPAPYDVYDENGGTNAGERTRGLYDPRGQLAGFFCWGEEGRVAPASELYAAEPEPLDFGIGLRPDLTGHGHGLTAAECALGWLKGTVKPEAFRLAVRGFNKRARTVYERLGFTPVALCGDFIIMLRDERPWRDVSRPLVNGMPVYPGDPGFERSLYRTAGQGGWNLSVMTLNAHCGTHIDAPAHIGLPGGTETVDVERLNGVAQLIDLGVQTLADARGRRVLVKTGGRGLTLDEARVLLDAGVDMIGIDGLSVGGEGAVREVHELLVSSAVLLETLSLDGFEPGWYQMRCLPLLIPGSDGAPARVFMRAMR